MSNYDTSLLTNKPYYDINEAIDENGFELEDLLKDNFYKFIKELVGRYRNLRKSYIKRNIKDVRFHTHSFKSPLM